MQKGNDRLREYLLTLRKDLLRLHNLDDTQREHVRSTIEHIDRMLASGGWEMSDIGELRRFLGDSMLSFEVSHPALTQSINTVIRALNSAGI